MKKSRQEAEQLQDMIATHATSVLVGELIDSPGLLHRCARRLCRSGVRPHSAIAAYRG